MPLAFAVMLADVQLVIFAEGLEITILELTILFSASVTLGSMLMVAAAPLIAGLEKLAPTGAVLLTPIVPSRCREYAKLSKGVPLLRGTVAL